MSKTAAAGFFRLIQLALLPLGVAGYVAAVPRSYRHPYQGPAPMVHQSTARTSYYDAAVQRHLSGVDQLVRLAAGFDPTRPAPRDHHGDEPGGAP